MAYNTKYLDQLLERYFAGETNLAEETELRQWLSSPDLPAAYQSYAALLRVWQDKKKEELDDTFFTSFEQALRQEAQPPTPSRKTPRLRPAFWVRSAAAVLLLATAGYWHWYEQSPPATDTINWAQYEPKTPEEAFRVYRNAMQKLTGDIKKGSARAAQKVDYLHDAGAYFK